MDSENGQGPGHGRNRITLFFYKNKSFGFGKKFKNKLRTKPGLMSRRTKEQTVSELAISKIMRTEHQNRAWLPLMFYCM